MFFLKCGRLSSPFKPFLFLIVDGLLRGVLRFFFGRIIGQVSKLFLPSTLVLSLGTLDLRFQIGWMLMTTGSFQNIFLLLFLSQLLHYMIRIIQFGFSQLMGRYLAKLCMSFMLIILDFFLAKEDLNFIYSFFESIVLLKAFS